MSRHAPQIDAVQHGDDSVQRGGDGKPVFPVRATLWGETEDLVQVAKAAARRGPFRRGWHFVDPVEHIAGVCPIDYRNPSPIALAADAGPGWAYEVRAFREGA